MNIHSEGEARETHVSIAYTHSRHRNQNEIAEDYVELISDLINKKGEARAVDLAHALGVSQATVSKTIGRLKQASLVYSQPYRSIFLTSKGRRLASLSRERHRIVMEFIVALGVPKRTAAMDAEGIEHHASKTTIRAMKRYLEKQ